MIVFRIVIRVTDIDDGIFIVVGIHLQQHDHLTSMNWTVSWRTKTPRPETHNGTWCRLSTRIFPRWLCRKASTGRFRQLVEDRQVNVHCVGRLLFRRMFSCLTVFILWFDCWSILSHSIFSIRAMFVVAQLLNACSQQQGVILIGNRGMHSRSTTLNSLL